MADKIGFRVRLRIRIAKGLTTEATNFSAVVSGKDVTISSQQKEEPLSKAKWLVLNARGFATEEAAQQFGTRLCSLVQLAALSSRLGADVGENKATSWVSEQFARASGLIEEHERIAPNVHGLAILPDNDSIRFPIINAHATVTADPEHFMSALRELGENDDIDLGRAAHGVHLLNFALMTSEPLGQMVLALSAVEEIGQKEKWTEAQKGLIKQLANAAEASLEVSEGERAEVVNAIRTGLHRLSLRQGVMRLLSEVGLEHMQKEWKRLYDIRSGIFHGRAHLSNSEIDQAAGDTIRLCGRIIIAIIAKDGGRVPSIAATHFKSEEPGPIQGG